MRPARSRDLTEEQPALALGTPVEDTAPPLSRDDLIRALNFPDTDKDVEGFAALRRALKDRTARQLIQALPGTRRIGSLTPGSGILRWAGDGSPLADADGSFTHFH